METAVRAVDAQKVDKARREAYERTVISAATKAQLIKALLDTDTDDPADLANFLEFFVFSYLRGPFGDSMRASPRVRSVVCSGLSGG